MVERFTEIREAMVERFTEIREMLWWRDLLK